MPKLGQEIIAGLKEAVAHASGEETGACVGTIDAAVIHVSRDAYTAFADLINAPAQDNPRIRKTMRTPAPWDGKDADQ